MTSCGSLQLFLNTPATLVRPCGVDITLQVVRQGLPEGDRVVVMINNSDTSIYFDIRDGAIDVSSVVVAGLYYQRTTPLSIMIQIVNTSTRFELVFTDAFTTVSIVLLTQPPCTARLAVPIPNNDIYLLPSSCTDSVVPVYIDTSSSRTAEVTTLGIVINSLRALDYNIEASVFIDVVDNPPRIVNIQAVRTHGSGANIEAIQNPNSGLGVLVLYAVDKPVHLSVLIAPDVSGVLVITELIPLQDICSAPQQGMAGQSLPVLCYPRKALAVTLISGFVQITLGSNVLIQVSYSYNPSSTSPVSNVKGFGTGGKAVSAYTTTGNDIIIDRMERLPNLTIIITFQGSNARFLMQSIIDYMIKDDISSRTGIGTLVTQPSCSPLTINIEALLSDPDMRVKYIEYTITDDRYYPCKICPLTGESRKLIPPVAKGMKTTVVDMVITYVIKGTGTTFDRIYELDVDYVELLRYILFKIVLGRLFGDWDTNWALTQNYQKLLHLVSSRYCPGVVAYLTDRSWLETYLN